MRYKSEEMKEKIISAIESFFLAHRRAPPSPSWSVWRGSPAAGSTPT